MTSVNVVAVVKQAVALPVVVNRGVKGDDGDDGWSPVFAVVADGDRRVQQVIDWAGGTGAKPATDKYVGAAGLVDALGDAVDIRGAAGADGDPGPAGDDGEDGQPGDDGLNGWSPVLAIVEDNDRRVLQVTDWAGGTGAKPATGKYVGVAGLVDAIGDAVDIRGAAGTDGDPGDPGPAGDDGEDGQPGANGADGLNGWSPVFAVVVDGDRRVQQVSDWTGGTGTKPALGKYVGSGGLVSAIGDAVDIRGATGQAGSGGSADPANSVTLLEDFINSSNANLGPFGISSRVSGAGSSVTTNGVFNFAFGGRVLNTGTAANGLAQLFSSQWYVFDNGPVVLSTRIYIQDLSASPDTYNFIFCVSQAGEVPPYDGVSIFYDSATSANWQVAYNGSISDSGIPVTTGYWTLEISQDLNAHTTELIINGSAISFSSTFVNNYPYSVYWTLEKTSGANNRYVIVDYLNMDKTFSAPR